MTSRDCFQLTKQLNSILYSRNVKRCEKFPRSSERQGNEDQSASTVRRSGATDPPSVTIRPARFSVGNRCCTWFVPCQTTPLFWRLLADATFSRSSLPALKKGAFLAGTWTASPVLGLRPCRASRLRGRKLPNPRSSTLSPSRNASAMHPKKMPTMASVCLLVKWTLSATLAASSAFVMFAAPAKEHALHGQGHQPPETTGRPFHEGRLSWARSGAALSIFLRVGYLI